MTITIQSLQKFKNEERVITVLTAYDATLARIISQAGIDVLLVGDSLGNVIQGKNTTISVTLDEMVYHTRCVAAGNQGSFLVADMPFMSYATVPQACENAGKLMQAGAMMVKMEGGKWLVPTVETLTERGVPVCGHLGLVPQSIHKLGGYKIQAKEQHEAEILLNDALALEKAGAQLLVLECVPSKLAEEVSRTLSIPVIGIGAGNRTDGQVLVLYDMLGLSLPVPKFAMNFLEGASGIKEAIENYITAVKSRQFPAG